jgi:hypothetical protein
LFNDYDVTDKEQRFLMVVMICGALITIGGYRYLKNRKGIVMMIVGIIVFRNRTIYLLFLEVIVLSNLYKVLKTVALSQSQVDILERCGDLAGCIIDCEGTVQSPVSVKVADVQPYGVGGVLYFSFT